MIDLTDWKWWYFKNKKLGRIRSYKHYCDECGADRGYIYPKKGTADKLCIRCSQVNYDNFPSNANPYDFIKNKNRKVQYRCTCIECGKDRGYHGRSAFSKICGSCATKKTMQNLSKEKQRERNLKKESTKRNKIITTFNYEQDLLVRKSIPNFIKRQVLEKYEGMCDICKANEKIHIHHLNAVHSHPDQQHDPDNLVCLCEKCHKKFHKIYGNGQYGKKITQKEYIIFKETFCEN